MSKSKLPLKAVQPAAPKTSVWHYLLSRDTLVATILVFVVMGSFVKLENALGLFDPKDITSKDFDYNDLAFNLLSKYKNVPVDTGIFIVNIGNKDRKQIAEVIDKVSKAQPKVVGVDVLFDQPKSVEQDSALKTMFRNNKLLVTAYQLDSANTHTRNCLADSGIGKRGFVNFTLENQNVIRRFNPYIVTTDTSLSFSTAIVRTFDVERYNTMLARNSTVETINYARSEDKFIIIDGGSRQPDFDVVKNKIVLIGTVDSGFNFEDKHFTPLNAKLTGKSLPDLSGVVIQANIIRMMLDNNYINHWNKWLNWLFAFVLCWVHMAFFISYFIEKHVWFHLAAKLAQLISSVFFIFLGLFLFYDFNEQIDMSGALIAIILAVDVLYFYEAGVVWLHHKKGYKTLFHHDYAN